MFFVHVFLLLSDCSIRVSHCAFFTCLVLLYISLANTLSTFTGLHYDSIFMYTPIFKLFHHTDYPVSVTTNHFWNFQNHT